MEKRATQRQDDVIFIQEQRAKQHQKESQRELTKQRMNVAVNTFYGTRIADEDKDMPYKTLEEKLRPFEKRKLLMENKINNEIEDE